MAVLEARLDPGDMVRVFGPARVRVASGLVILLGAELGAGGEAFIARHRSYTIKAVEASRVELELLDDARVERPSPGDEPIDEWIIIADKILGSCRLPCTVVVLGPVEAGKTSFTALLANRALARGITPAIVDADVGQADIGPPGFVSMALVSDWVVWLRELEPDYSRFVGSIEPGPATGKILSAAAELAARAREMGAGVVVVDTDGWVEGWAAMEYKADLLRIVGAEHAVVLGDRGLHAVVERVLGGRVMYARSPRVIAERDRGDRRLLRSANYRRFLADAQAREIDLSRVGVYGSCVFASERLGDRELYSDIASLLAVEVLYVGVFPGGYCVVVDSEDPVESNALRSLQKRLQGDVIVVHTGGFRGVLAALTDDKGSDHPAIVEEVDLDSRRVRVRSAYTGPVARVGFGRLRLGEDYTETGKRRIWI